MDGAAWEVRDEVSEVSELYATYAYDPKTASNEPRVILADSDLIKISIADSDRDKRTGVLIRGGSHSTAADAIGDDDVPTTLAAAIRTDLTEDGLDFPTTPDPDSEVDTDGDDDIKFSSHEGNDDGIWIYNSAGTNDDDSTIDDSGNVTLNFSRSGSPN